MTTLAQEENLNLGDKSPNKRHEKAIEKMLQQPVFSVPAAFQQWHDIKEIYSFCDNPKVTIEKLLNHQLKVTKRHIKAFTEEADILLLQGATDLNYHEHERQGDLGTTYTYISRGALIQPTIAMTPSGMNLGLITTKIWTKIKEGNKAPKQVPIEHRERNRWLASYKASQDVAKENPNKTMFNIGDSEGDIYECCLEGLKSTAKNLFFIIRTWHSRKHKVNKSEESVKETIQNSAPIGKITFCYKKKGYKIREVTQTIKTAKIVLDSPQKKSQLPPVTINALLAEEQNPPKGQVPIKWLLYTDYPIETLEDAQKIIKYYTACWEIETFFSVLKTGCGLEQMRLEISDRLEKILSLYMVVSSKIMFLLKLRRSYPDLPCDIIFSTFEWQSVYLAIHCKSLPKKLPSLGEIITCIAQLGGYFNRKSDHPPGPKAMWIGMQKMRMMTLALELSKTIF